ncbi:MAG: hypothetical protein Kow00129_06250 [Thermoleophilia bacterium]
MRLEGRVQEMGLPEVFRLVKISRKTGALEVRSGRQWGNVYFRDGQVYYAASSASGPTLGERLVKAGELSAGDLKAVLQQQQQEETPRLLGTLLRERELVSDQVLARYLQEQIEDAVFNLFGLEEAEFHFDPGGEPPVEDVVVALDAEAVIMEGCRRVDEWRLISERIGSLEKVPSLSPLSSAPEVTLKRNEWEVVCFIDGHRDINTIIAESGLDRFRTAKVVYQLVSAGLAVTRDPTLELLGKRVAIALRGPIDIYNLTFLTTACTGDISSHLRVESVEDEEIEVQMSAGVREADDGEDALVYFSEARTPLAVVRRMALETSGYVVLVNVNSADSVAVSRSDVALMRAIGDRPYVVATYSSMADEGLEEAEVRRLLQLEDEVPVLPCALRDPADVGAVLETLMERVP